VSMSVTVTGDTRRLRFDWPAAAAAWAGSVSPLARSAVSRAAPLGEGPYRGDARKPPPGRLRTSMKARTEASAGQVMVVIYSTAPYAKYVVGGTRAHPIAARAGGRLAFIGGDGAWHFPQSVRHPGTRANDFPRRAIAPLEPWLAARFAAAVREAMTP
jgi:hypothetical protein